MQTSKCLHISFLFISFYLSLTLGSSAQEIINYRKNFFIPNIDGYLGLKCDFHIHTIFSDGTVWPSERVNEAWMDGLDAIAITDHIEYRPNMHYLKADHNSSFEIAKDAALKQSILLIHGTEITKKYPGHFNALFIDDANPISNDNYLLSIDEAIKQGGFIVLNHPRDAVPDGPEWWTPELKDLYQKGYINGIEIFNWNHYYPKAFDFAMENKTTILSCTDIHNSSAQYLNVLKMQRRPMTIVFAKERTLEGIKDALINQRTVAFFRETLYGNEELLRKLFINSVYIDKAHLIEDAGFKYVNIINVSDLTLILKPINTSIANDLIQLYPQGSALIKVPDTKKDMNPSIEFEVQNLFIRSNKKLKIKLIYL